jgi:hypothetical protein
MSRLCRLDALSGQERICPEEGCPFWEPGGAVLEGGCVFERLDLLGSPGLVSELLRVRDLLAAAVPGDEELHAWHECHHLLNESGEE